MKQTNPHRCSSPDCAIPGCMGLWRGPETDQPREIPKPTPRRPSGREGWQAVEADLTRLEGEIPALIAENCRVAWWRGYRAASYVALGIILLIEGIRWVTT